MPTKLNSGQMYLFPVNLRELADSIGLDWWAAKKLYDDEWLSFNPDQTQADNDLLEAEFRFLGSLVAAGCDPHILKRLLTGLEKPYRYDLSSIYYDWTTKEWKDLPKERNAQDVTSEFIQSLEEDGDYDQLREISDQVREALSGQKELEGEDSDDLSDDQYDFIPSESSIVLAAKLMVWKLASSSILDTPQKRIVIGKIFGVLQRLPNVTLGEYLRLDLTGPHRNFGKHEIYHFWTIELHDDGALRISSGGHFYRPETGGDTFSCMSWEVAPRLQPIYEDYLDSLRIVDDADTFEKEIRRMKINEGGYEIVVEDSSVEDWQSNTPAEEADTEDARTDDTPPFIVAEQALAKYSDISEGRKREDYHHNPPETCDICGCALNERNLFVDGRLKGSLGWANMCAECFRRKGEGIGWGEGQLFAKQSNGEWLLTGGFESKE